MARTKRRRINRSGPSSDDPSPKTTVGYRPPRRSVPPKARTSGSASTSTHWNGTPLRERNCRVSAAPTVVACPSTYVEATADGRSGGRQRGHCVAARLLTDPTRLRAHTAVFVVVRVALTLRCTRSTRLGTSLQQSVRHASIEFCLATQATPRCRADITALGTAPHATHHHAHVGLPEAGVRTGRACLRTIEARLNARDKLFC